MPPAVVARANDIMKELESGSRGAALSSPEVKGTKESSKSKAKHSDGIQLSFFNLEDPVLMQIRDEIRKIDINSLTPIEALNKLNDIKKICGIK
ncbi:MAG: DNA mismatch repair protein MutS, partial [Bacteroidales bacterium]|nr:DNA mismatch repair protein MutS [Bacteroidales bacterium]